MTKSNTIIYLTGKDAYRREYSFTKHCKKSEVSTLLENRENANVIICKHMVRKYDKIFQKAGFYMTEFDDYSSSEYILRYERFA